MKPPTPDELRAAKLSKIPGVTIAEACRRFAVTAAAVSRARKLAGTAPSVAELALAALTENGTLTSGTLDDLPRIAGWIDYVNHDGCTPAEARALLATCPGLTIAGTRWTLATPWP